MQTDVDAETGALGDYGIGMIKADRIDKLGIGALFDPFKDREGRGIFELCARRVFMDDCEELVPDHLDLGKDVCRKSHEWSFKNSGLDIREGSSDGRRPTGHVRRHTSATGDRQCLPPNCVPGRKAYICDTVEYEFKPAAVQCLALATTVGKARERRCRIGSKDADDYYRLEAAEPLEDRVAGPDHTLDG